MTTVSVIRDFTRSLPLELVNHVELQALEKILRRRRISQVDGPPDKAGEGQLNVLVSLVENLGAVLADVAALADVAGVENGENRFALDEGTRVGELPITLLLRLAEAHFGPIGAALPGVARSVLSDSDACSACGRGPQCREV